MKSIKNNIEDIQEVALLRHKAHCIDTCAMFNEEHGEYGKWEEYITRISGIMKKMNYSKKEINRLESLTDTTGIGCDADWHENLIDKKEYNNDISEYQYRCEMIFHKYKEEANSIIECFLGECDDETDCEYDFKPSGLAREQYAATI